MKFRTLFRGIIILSLGMMHSSHAFAKNNELVVILHGAAQKPSHVNMIEKAIEKKGFDVANFDYYTHSSSFDELYGVVRKKVSDMGDKYQKIHFVGYSLGAILIRKLMEENRPDNAGRVVQIAPPNQGSELIESAQNNVSQRTLWGKGAMALGTGNEAVIHNLQAVEGYELGIIAGKRSLNTLTEMWLGTKNDGVVSVKNTRVEGMKEHSVVNVNHIEIFKDRKVIRKVVNFVQWGTFEYY